MDVRIDNEKLNFKFRVNCLILNNDKVLLLDMNKNGFLCLPGGHVHVGEDTKEAVIRETMEEVGISSKNQKLIAVIENFFSNKAGKKYHELSFYYLMEDAEIPQDKQSDFHYVEHDEDKLVDLDFKWISLDEVDKYDIRPVALKQILKEKKFDFSHIFVK